jgi:hypothetical protein
LEKGIFPIVLMHEHHNMTHFQTLFAKLLHDHKSRISITIDEGDLFDTVNNQDSGYSDKMSSVSDYRGFIDEYCNAGLVSVTHYTATPYRIYTDVYKITTVIELRPVAINGCPYIGRLEQFVHEEIPDDASNDDIAEALIKHVKTTTHQKITHGTYIGRLCIVPSIILINTERLNAEHALTKSVLEMTLDGCEIHIVDGTNIDGSHRRYMSTILDTCDITKPQILISRGCASRGIVPKPSKHVRIEMHNETLYGIFGLTHIVFVLPKITHNTMLVQMQRAFGKYPLGWAPTMLCSTETYEKIAAALASQVILVGEASKDPELKYLHISGKMEDKKYNQHESMHHHSSKLNLFESADFDAFPKSKSIDYLQMCDTELYVLSLDDLNIHNLYQSLPLSLEERSNPDTKSIYYYSTGNNLAKSYIKRLINVAISKWCTERSISYGERHQYGWSLARREVILKASIYPKNDDKWQVNVMTIANEGGDLDSIRVAVFSKPYDEREASRSFATSDMSNCSYYIETDMMRYLVSTSDVQTRTHMKLLDVSEQLHHKNISEFLQAFSEHSGAVVVTVDIISKYLKLHSKSSDKLINGGIYDARGNYATKDIAYKAIKQKHRSLHGNSIQALLGLAIKEAKLPPTVQVLPTLPPKLPTLPPKLPTLPALPKLPTLPPKLPTLPSKLPTLPALPKLPTLPALPKLSVLRTVKVLHVN